MAWGIRWTFIRALKSAKLYFDELYFSKTYNLSAKNIIGNYVMTLKGDKKLENTDSWFEKWHKEFG